MQVAADQMRLLGVFEAFHLALATPPTDTDVPWVQDETDDEGLQLPSRREVLDVPALWYDALPEDWQTHWNLSSQAEVFGSQFVHRLFEFLGAEETIGTSAFAVSWLELSALVFSLNFPHPVAGQSSKGQIWVDESSVAIGMQAPLSVAFRIRYISTVCRSFARFFELPLEFVQGIDRSFLGISVPLSGVILILSDESLTRIDSVLGQFTSSRPIRRANDTCRPFSRD